MKARDVVPGWPRGRSTGGFGTRDLAYYKSILMFWPWVFGRSPVLDDVEREIDYHADQQAMVNAYFEQWRTHTFPMVAFGRYLQWID